MKITKVFLSLLGIFLLPYLLIFVLKFTRYAEVSISTDSFLSDRQQLDQQDRKLDLYTFGEGNKFTKEYTVDLDKQNIEGKILSSRIIDSNLLGYAVFSDKQNSYSLYTSDNQVVKNIKNISTIVSIKSTNYDNTNVFWNDRILSFSTTTMSFIDSMKCISGEQDNCADIRLRTYDLDGRERKKDFLEINGSLDDFSGSSKIKTGLFMNFQDTTTNKYLLSSTEKANEPGGSRLSFEGNRVIGFDSEEFIYPRESTNDRVYIKCAVDSGKCIAKKVKKQSLGFALDENYNSSIYKTRKYIVGKFDTCNFGSVFVVPSLEICNWWYEDSIILDTTLPNGQISSKVIARTGTMSYFSDGKETNALEVIGMSQDNKIAILKLTHEGENRFVRYYGYEIETGKFAILPAGGFLSQKF
jgi:hypothetical protein